MIMFNKKLYFLYEGKRSILVKNKKYLMNTLSGLPTFLMQNVLQKDMISFVTTAKIAIITNSSILGRSKKRTPSYKTHLKLLMSFCSSKPV